MITKIYKGTDFAIRLNIMDCGGRRILPQNCMEYTCMLWTTDYDNCLVKTPNEEGDVYIQRDEYANFIEGVLKYEVRIIFKSDYYTGQKQLVKFGETNLYINKK